MYYTPVTAADIAGTKYTLADFAGNEPQVEVWEENWGVLMLFRTYSTQWRVGANGPMALDYNVFHHALDRRGVRGEQFEEWIDKLGTIEVAALKHLHTK